MPIHRSRHRTGERGSIPFRTGRFFTIDSCWYFTSREGRDHGPYYSKDEALDALKAYLVDMPEQDDDDASVSH